MIKSKKQEINKKLNTHNRSEPRNTVKAAHPLQEKDAAEARLAGVCCMGVDLPSHPPAVSTSCSRPGVVSLFHSQVYSGTSQCLGGTPTQALQEYLQQMGQFHAGHQRWGHTCLPF